MVQGLRMVQRKGRAWLEGKIVAWTKFRRVTLAELCSRRRCWLRGISWLFFTIAPGGTYKHMERVISSPFDRPLCTPCRERKKGATQLSTVLKPLKMFSQRCSFLNFFLFQRQTCLSLWISIDSSHQQWRNETENTQCHSALIRGNWN